MPPEIQYYVALDLGSETMAAYYESRRTVKGGMIHLQAHAAKLMDDNKSPFLLTENGGKPSPRLRNRIGLEDKRQGKPLPPEHAKLNFLNAEDERSEDYGKSLFSFFYAPNTEFARAILPNPKIPFQEGGANVIPEVKTPEEKMVQHFPEQLLAHLTVQVLRNLVLRSPQLCDVAPEEIHLVLTVPNVYSLVHVKNLLDFIKDNTEFGRLSFLYESDAVSYLLLENARGDGPKDFEAFKARVLGRKNQEALRIVTIDIGRGTTDLSLVEIQEPPGRPAGIAMDLNQRQHFVLARTGKSDGGNRLSYILASHYEDIIRQAFAAHERDLPFSLLGVVGTVDANQSFTLTAIEHLIETIKPKMTRDFRLRLTEAEQLPLVDQVVFWLMRGLDPSWDGAKNSADRDLLKLHERLRRDLVLPEKLPRKLRGWFLSWLHSFRRSSKGLGGSSVDEEKLLSLRNEIENYVRHNAVDLLDELADMATRREDIAAGREGHGRRKDIIDKDKTFVVVAGQASQFAPVAYAIREHLAREYDLPFENVHFLRSTDAKEACCRGAVHFLRSLVNLANPGELHGVYGFLNAAANEQANAFKAADMAAIRAGGACTVTFKYGAQYWLIFSPRIEVKTGLSPRLFDGKTAIISGFEGYQFNLRYEPDLMALFVNEQEVQLATYGGVNESIYPKTWPEVLKPITPPRPN